MLYEITNSTNSIDITNAFSCGGPSMLVVQDQEMLIIIIIFRVKEENEFDQNNEKT